MISQEITAELLNFINQSPTCFHTVANVKKVLEEAGYEQLSEKERFSLKKNGKYFVIRNDASLIAFEIPKKAIKGFRIIASHTDSPCFKIKENPEIALENAYVKLNVEKYGGMILSTWLDRPLSIAGRVIVKGKQGLESRLVNLEQNLCVIPNVAIHFNREINKGMEYNPQVDMQPLWAVAKDCKLKSLLAQKLGIEEEKILGMDLFLYNRAEGCFIGYQDSFIGAPRLDDTQCVFGSLKGFLQAESKEDIKMCCMFDHEEVGSRTRQGADSDFLQTTLHRIVKALGIEETFSEILADSFLVSADNAHALHPNHPEKSDITNRPILNGGIVIKYHGSQQYTTDGYTGAVIKDICQKAKVPYQTFHNRSDILGGSTLGNISISHCSIPSADIGLPQLAMHSAFETAGAEDMEYFVRFVKEFYEYRE